jgi:hypothetical protein
MHWKEESLKETHTTPNWFQKSAQSINEENWRLFMNSSILLKDNNGDRNLKSENLNFISKKINKIVLLRIWSLLYITYPREMPVKWTNRSRSRPACSILD